MVGTGFERHVDMGAHKRLRPVPPRLRVAQGHDFGMRSAGLLGVSCAEQPALAVSDHAADPGIGVAEADGLTRQGQRHVHGFGGREVAVGVQDGVSK